MIWTLNPYYELIGYFGHRKTVDTEEDSVTFKRRGPAHSEDMGSSILSACAQ